MALHCEKTTLFTGTITGAATPASAPPPAAAAAAAAAAAGGGAGSERGSVARRCDRSASILAEDRLG